ncbi:MAG: phosphoribosylanthranilate isomerase [Planctomycetaceae bacterium]|nr:phosphoribosylanthranilate isomerase [Planctomycetaceae bacterium]
MNRFGTKICGITSVADAIAAVESGVDAIGLNFSINSKRRVETGQAQEIISEVRRIDPRVICIGVFVEQSPEEVEQIAARLELDVIQLHGDQPTALLARSWSRPILWVVRVPICSESEMAARLSTAVDSAITDSGWLPRNAAHGRESQFQRLAGVLIDAYTTADYGGTGQTVAWDPLGQRRSWVKLGWAASAWPTDLPLILAGGLNPDNVARAIGSSRPTAVDVASGVEVGPGVKSPEKMKAFVAAARSAFQLLETNCDSSTTERFFS